MSVLTKTEVKSVKGIIFQTVVLIALILGGVTMIYPFILMFSGSLRSEMDSSEIRAVPRFLVDDSMLARKFLEMKYNFDVSTMNLHRGYEDFGFRQATLPERIAPGRLRDLHTWVDEVEIPDHWWVLGGTEVRKKLASANATRFVERLQKRYNGDLRALGEDLGAPIPKWRYVGVRIPEWANPRFQYQVSSFYDEYFALLQERPLAERAFVSVTGWFKTNIIFPRYNKSSVDAYNAAHARPIERFEDFSLPRTVPGPDQPRLREEWIEFVSTMLNAAFVRTTASDEEYRKFLAGKYPDIDSLNARWVTTAYASFDDIRLPDEDEWIAAGPSQDFIAFLAGLPKEALYLVGPEYNWHDWLQTTYPDLDALKQAHEAAYPAWSAASIPVVEAELQHVRDHARQITWEAATRNFRNVFSEIIFQGRPFLNTIIFVTLSLFFCLTIQPLAAYALSRFSPPGEWRIILIFMATMAFPPMVGMIPQFLILRKLHLLNTFIALILPVIVNGYLVFLLKGFFDSLPQHLYEAALIDGAGEFRMFWEIAMALSKPILAVVALGTFQMAWLSFMSPLLVCPKEEMHVLAIWLYQFQQSAPTPAVFASILVTSIPTLLIFAFTQRTIMRGIAVPAEK